MFIIYTILAITILYFLFALLGDLLKRLIGRKICAICVAVSLTWTFLLILKLVGFEIDVLVIAILMGQSVVGLMVELEKEFTKKGWQNFWLIRILIIVGGTLFTYWLLKEHYVWSLLLLFLGITLFLIIISKRTKMQLNPTKNSKEYQEAKNKLEKLMEDCC